MKTKKILAGALAAAVVTTSLPGMGVPVFARTEYPLPYEAADKYTATTPFAFPMEVNTTATLEAERATSLHNDTTSDHNSQENATYPMKVVLDDDGVTAIHDMASGGRDYATYAYTAEAGLYEVVANCQCGGFNTMVLSEENNKIQQVSVKVAKTKNDNNQLIWGTSNKFLLVVNESGAGTLKITSADNQAAPRIDSLKITKAVRFQFPSNANSATLEAESGFITDVTNNDDENGTYPAKVATANWTDNGTGNGYFVTSVNTGDSVAYLYHAEKPGIYEFTARYRSGSTDNHYTWSSDNGQIVAGSVQAGNSGPNAASVTKTTTFKVVVKEAGDGILTFAVPEPAEHVKNMAMTDRFDITLVVDKSALVSAIEEAGKLNLSEYEDAGKDDFTTALAAANTVNTNYSDTLTQEDVNNAVNELNTAKDALTLKATTTAIQIKTQPVKKVYNLGEAVDTAGLVVEAVKSTGNVELTEADYTVTGFDSATTGRKTLTVTLNANAALTDNTEVEVVDGASLDAKVTEAKTKTAGKHYTAATKTAFDAKLMAAKAVQDDIKAANGDGNVVASVTAARVEAATTELDSAMNDLEEMYKVTVPVGAELTVETGVESESGSDNANKWVYVPVATKVTVTAPEINGENKKFAAWTWDKQKLSESNEYAFYVVGDMDLQMTYDASTVDEAEVVLVGSTKYTEKKRSFIAKRSVSKKCQKVLEHGVVVTDQKGWETYYGEGATNPKPFEKGNTRTKCSRKYSEHDGLLAYNGTFKANLKVANKSEKWYGRPYVIYQDAKGVTKTVYAKNVIKY